MWTDDVTKSFEGFAEEARERWGETTAYAESARRTRRYGKAEWQAIADEASALYARLVALMRAGAAANDAAVQAAVAEHRAHITRWFYDCTPAILDHGLGEMYVADARFTANLDQHGAGARRSCAMRSRPRRRDPAQLLQLSIEQPGLSRAQSGRLPAKCSRPGCASYGRRSTSSSVASAAPPSPASVASMTSCTR